MKRLTAKQIINIILIVLLLIFAGQNVISVPIKFLVWKFDLPLIITIAFAFFIGYLTVMLFGKTAKKSKKPCEEPTEKVEEDNKPTAE